MDSSKFLQRPGGLGPNQRVKPIGSLATQIPAAYESTPESIEIRRSMTLDDINRVQAQYARDRGESAREPVGPTNYQEGNIMPSSQITGPAGYNHQDKLVLPDRAADMSKAEYLVKEQNTMDPNLRAQLQILTTLPQQNFYNVQDQTTNLMTQNYAMPDSLAFQMPMAGERMRGGKKK
jgi:hypothetical protein